MNPKLLLKYNIYNALMGRKSIKKSFQDTLKEEISYEPSVMHTFRNKIGGINLLQYFPIPVLVPTLSAFDVLIFHDPWTQQFPVLSPSR